MKAMCESSHKETAKYVAYKETVEIIPMPTSKQNSKLCHSLYCNPLLAIPKFPNTFLPFSLSLSLSLNEL